MRVLIVGANGQLARALHEAAPQNTEIVGLSRADLDVRDADAIAQTVREHRPDLVFNGAAYNLVDRAETEPEAAFAINAVAVAELARACRDIDAALVHFSTDFVFDGEKTAPYDESDATRPLSVYGASKLAGENVCLAASPRHFAIRVCRLFGPSPIQEPGSSKKPSGNFPLLMLKLASEREFVRVVGDQIGTPTYTPDLARAVWQLVQMQLPTGAGGLFQLSNSGEVSFADYARATFEIAGANCRVESVTSEEYNAPARRPLYSTLSNARAHAYAVAPLRDWRLALEEFLREQSA